MLSVFGRFGEIESINMTSDGRFSLMFFDSRSSLAVQSALTAGPTDSSPQYTEQVVVSADQLLHLLLVGSTISDEMVAPDPPPSKGFDRGKSVCSEFAINLRNIEKGFDTRTTIMIRNIPKTFSQTFFLSILEAKFPSGTFDFVYLPMDLMNGVNVGYAFVNFQDSQTIIPFFNFFNNKTWRTILQTLDISGARAFEPDISNRSCKVTYARIQGLEQLNEHFRSSSIMNQPDSIRPYFHTDSE
jgi:RNA recognition motif-containing protein